MLTRHRRFVPARAAIAARLGTHLHAFGRQTRIVNCDSYLTMRSSVNNRLGMTVGFRECSQRSPIVYIPFYHFYHFVVHDVSNCDASKA